MSCAWQCLAVPAATSLPEPEPQLSALLSSILTPVLQTVAGLLKQVQTLLTNLSSTAGLGTVLAPILSLVNQLLASVQGLLTSLPSTVSGLVSGLWLKITHWHTWKKSWLNWFKLPAVSKKGADFMEPLLKLLNWAHQQINCTRNEESFLIQCLSNTNCKLSLKQQLILKCVKCNESIYFTFSLWLSIN